MKKLVFIFIFCLSLLATTQQVMAVTRYINIDNIGEQCKNDDGTPITATLGSDIGIKVCNPEKSLVCLIDTSKTQGKWTCQPGSPTSNIFGNIIPPLSIINIGFGSAGINQVLNVILQIIYIFGGIIFLFMIVISAVQWIVSGGDKEAVGKARARITYAIIGIVVLSLAFVIAKLVGDITGFKFFN